MDDTRRMRGRQRSRDLRRDVEDGIDGQWFAHEPRAKRFPIHQREHEGAAAVALFDPVYRRDVRVVERRQQARFPFEACQPIGIVRERRRQDLDRDVAPQARIAGAIHVAHPAGAEQRPNLVGAEPPPDHPHASTRDAPRRAAGRARASWNSRSMCLNRSGVMSAARTRAGHRGRVVKARL